MRVGKEKFMRFVGATFEAEAEVLTCNNFLYKRGYKALSFIQQPQILAALFSDIL